MKKETLTRICRFFLLLAFLSLVLLIFGPWEGTPGGLIIDKVLVPFNYVIQGLFGGGERIILQSDIDPSLHLLPINVLEDRFEEAKTKAISDPSEENMVFLKGLEHVLHTKVLERGAKINQKIFMVFLFCTFFGLLMAMVIAMRELGEVSIKVLKEASFWQIVLSVVISAGLAKWVFPKST